jgi:CubicO group peptidase (beta-lactamase class C family)
MRHAAAVALLLTGLTSGRMLKAQSWSAVETAVQHGIRQRVYPGAVVVVGRRDTILYARGFGHLSWSGRSPRPDPGQTLWDLASLTKVVATASTAMVLVDRGLLDLAAPVASYLPSFAGGPDRHAVTVRMLLDHTSGLPPYAPLYRQPTRRDALAVLDTEPLDRTPGMSARYSDLNAILLGLVIEEVTAESLDLAASRLVFAPLGMGHTHFGVAPGEVRKTAPSRVDRGVAIAGVVNDENAVRLGGIAGHAGLFATGRDLGRFAQGWLAMGVGSGGRWVSEATIQQFLERTPQSGTRTLGWDTPDTVTVPSMFGTMAHDGVVGHTGWTGTSLWIDPIQDLFVVFLTNRSLNQRVRRSLQEIRLVRAEVADAARRVAQGECLAGRGTGC